MRVSVYRLLGLRRLVPDAPRASNPRCLGTAAAAAAEDKIAIPNRIKRSPTDILKALAGTVGRDTTGPHYKYLDDPYLTPASNLTKRSYALSKEAGRKAARWVRDEHPFVFTHRPDDPFVEKFYPKTIYKDDHPHSGEISAKSLALLVGRGQVNDAITVYNLCKEKGIEVPGEVLQALLELLCFYNCEEPLDGEWLEERWYRQTSSSVRKTWRDQGLAEDLFASLPTKGSPAYCALIRGMAHYYQVDRAWQLYQECREDAIPLDTGTYNALIRVVSLLRDAADLRWQLVKELLSAMAESGTHPDLGTLNATLEALTQMSGWRQAQDLSLQVLAEFRQQDVQPSLATYYYLLTIHCRQRGPISRILLDILDHIEGQSFTPQHPADTQFFVTAMQTARTHLRSLEAAQRVHKLLCYGENQRLIGDSYKESVYFRHYFALSCAALPFEEFMEVYRELVPHVYTPEPGIMQEVLQAVSASGCLHHLPQLWSDIILFGLELREQTVALTLTALTQHEPEETEEGQALTGLLTEVVKDVWARVQGQGEDRRNKLIWTSQMLGDTLQALVAFGEYDTATDVLKLAVTNPQAVLGFLPHQPLLALLRAAVARGDAPTAVSVALYAQDAGHMEAGRMAQEVQSGVPLTAQQRAQISSLLGLDTPLPPPPTPTTVP